MIGVLDWGIGGLWALRHLRARHPTADLLYLSDAGNLPYGLQPRARLRDSVQAAITRLRRAGAEEILVACHSASTALRDLPDTTGVHGVIAPDAIPGDAGSIAILGGARTIRSRAWRAALADRPIVHQRIAQPLSAAVEAGRAEHPHTRAVLRQILRPVRGVDTVVLACTHYAALDGLIREEMPGVRIVDPALWVAERLLVRPGEGRVLALTTGNPAEVAAVVSRALPELVGIGWRGLR